MYTSFNHHETVLLTIVMFLMPSGIRAETSPCPGNSITILDKGSGKRTCVECLKCPAGEGLTVNCGDVITPQTPIVCKPCVLGETYSDANEPGACRDCENCREYQETTKTCTLTSKAQCGNCKAGAYPEGLLGFCVPCSPCCNDKRDVIIPGCQIPGVPKNMQCTFARSETCRRKVTRPGLPTKGLTTTSPKAVNPSRASRSIPHPTATIAKTTVANRNHSEKLEQLPVPEEEAQWKPITGGVVGAVIAVAIVPFVVWCFIKCRNQTVTKENQEAGTDDEDDENQRPETEQGEDIANPTTRVEMPPVQDTEDSPWPYSVQETPESRTLDAGKEMSHSSPSQEIGPVAGEKSGKAAYKKATEVTMNNCPGDAHRV